MFPAGQMGNQKHDVALLGESTNYKTCRPSHPAPLSRTETPHIITCIMFLLHGRTHRSDELRNDYFTSDAIIH